MIRKLSLATVLCLFTLTLYAAKTVPDQVWHHTSRLKAVYDRPAQIWESEALPIGNGYMGAMIYGGVYRDVIQTNEKTLWSGGPGEDPAYDGGHLNTPEVNRATMQAFQKFLQKQMNAFTATTAQRHYMEMLYYQFGRYLLIASSRPGSLPANLQGVWGERLNNPWNADYHTNINIQMNYWLAEPTNLSECHLPMAEFVKSLVPRGSYTANYYYARPDGGDVRGWVANHEVNIWGNTAPAVRGTPHIFPQGAIWMCQDIWEHYQFTMDKAFLSEYYDTMLGAALFWVDNLWTDERDGSLVCNPSYSPEHGDYSLGCSTTQAMVWEMFAIMLKASRVLGREGDSEIAEIRTALSRLAGPQIGLGGQFMEWKDEVTKDITGDGHHRHTNHLFWLHPGSQIVPGRSADGTVQVRYQGQTHQMSLKKGEEAAWPVAGADTVTISCVGASITEGYGTTQPWSVNAYPARLGRLLGPRYRVLNFGRGGCTMLQGGDCPYTDKEKFQPSLQSAPDIVFIDLGGNDAKLRNRIHKAHFVSDACALVRRYQQLPSRPRVILMTAIPGFTNDSTEIWDTAIVRDINPLIIRAARELRVEVLDMHPLFEGRPDLLPDAIHPNDEGARIMAQKMADYLTAYPRKPSDSMTVDGLQFFMSIPIAICE